MGPVIIPFLQKTENGTDRNEKTEYKSHLKKAGNSYYGRRDHPGKYCDYFAVLHQRLSEDHSGAVSDRWVSD